MSSVVYFLFILEPASEFMLYHLSLVIIIFLKFFPEAQKPESEDVFLHEDEEANAADEGKNRETGGWTEARESSEDEKPDSKDKDEVVPDESILEVAVRKGLSGALKLLKDRATLKETVEWCGRNMDKKKSKLVGIIDDDESKDALDRIALC